MQMKEEGALSMFNQNFLMNSKEKILGLKYIEWDIYQKKMSFI